MEGLNVFPLGGSPAGRFLGHLAEVLSPTQFVTVLSYFFSKLYALDSCGDLVPVLTYSFSPVGRLTIEVILLVTLFYWTMFLKNIDHDSPFRASLGFSIISDRWGRSILF